MAGWRGPGTGAKYFCGPKLSSNQATDSASRSCAKPGKNRHMSTWYKPRPSCECLGLGYGNTPKHLDYVLEGVLGTDTR